MSLIEKTTTIDLISEMHKAGEKIDAMTLARKFQKETGKHIDWHEFAYYLDHLYTKGFLKITKPGGFVQYDLNI